MDQQSWALIDNFAKQYPLLMSLILIWLVFWKAAALWIAARKNQSAWFVAILILNLFGILEILYIFVFSKLKKTQKPQFTEEKAKVIGKKLKIDWEKIPFDQFYRGLSVELEHGKRDDNTNVTNDDLELTAKIALAHLNEFADYYERLDRMEQEAELFWQQKK